MEDLFVGEGVGHRLADALVGEGLEAEVGMREMVVLGTGRPTMRSLPALAMSAASRPGMSKLSWTSPRSMRARRVDWLGTSRITTRAVLGIGPPTQWSLRT